MKFSCEKFILQSAIITTARAVAAKSTIPALEGLLIKAEDGLFLTGYDLETGICTQVAARIEEKGAIVLNSRLFGEIIRKLADDIVSVSSDSKNMVTIKSGASEFNILGLPADEFPEMPSVEKQSFFTISEKSLKSAVSETLFAVSDNESRPIHTGSLFEVEGKTLTIVSVDGYRLALRREQIKEEKESCSFVVPGAALREVEKIAGESENMAIITQGSRHIMFSLGETIVVSRRLEGEFLAYKKAIPRKNEICFTVDKKRLIDSVERVSLIIDEKMKSPVRCLVEGERLKISTNSAIGNAYDECGIEGDKKSLEIGINNRFLLEALKAAPAEKIRIEMNTAVSPCILLPAEGEETFLYMVLPMRLRAAE
jgi:DNA polymerase-3 subunit beta